ncbi:hypothetical protein [Streptomyces sp. NPDC058579]|uniref:hypothetical protein n=1 Tax=Streptomyces sp. NPDC058579 TaxID=3346548 RepID=UPI00365350AB
MAASSVCEADKIPAVGDLVEARPVVVESGLPKALNAADGYGAHAAAEVATHI